MTREPEEPVDSNEHGGIYDSPLLEAGTELDKRQIHDEQIERFQRERDAAEDALRKEYRDTYRWALVVMIALTTFTVAVSVVNVSSLNSELRDVRDRLTVLEERNRSQTGTSMPSKNRHQLGANIIP